MPSVVLWAKPKRCSYGGPSCPCGCFTYGGGIWGHLLRLPLQIYESSLVHSWGYTHLVAGTTHLSVMLWRGVNCSSTVTDRGEFCWERSKKGKETHVVNLGWSGSEGRLFTSLGCPAVVMYRRRSLTVMMTASEHVPLYQLLYSSLLEVRVSAQVLSLWDAC
jgi:hypothetical protein